MPGIYRLKGVVKQYDWGGLSYIPSLLQVSNTAQQPFAEYWMGIHPLGTAAIENEGNWEAITRSVEGLPYLLKVLDVKKMLSIQVHPGKKAAEEDFAKENKAGIPLDSPKRNYKDDNHKPELMVALGDFWLLHGFKPAKELEYTLLNVAELRALLPMYNESGYAGLYKYVMEMPQDEVNRVLKPLMEHIADLYIQEDPDKSDEDYWASKAAATFNRDGNIDRGIFSIYLFNLVHLKKGEGIFQDAGVPHAYLEGQNIEIMANSDNVLRGGLTSKYIDVKELLRHVKCEATVPQILSGKKINEEEKIYTTPAADFELSVFELTGDTTATFFTTTPEILLLAEGNALLYCGETMLDLKPGTPSALALPGSSIQVKGNDKALVFRASVPIHNR